MLHGFGPKIEVKRQFRISKASNVPVAQKNLSQPNRDSARSFPADRTSDHCIARVGSLAVMRSLAIDKNGFLAVGLLLNCLEPALNP